MTNLNKVLNQSLSDLLRTKKLTKKIDDIPADVTILMTADLIRAFKSEGCEPTCHNCGKDLIVGILFKLAEFKKLECYTGWTLKTALEQAESEDEMLCNNCTADDLRNSRLELWEIKRKDISDREYHRGRYHGYTRIHI